jgi:alkylhydroperoxidase family enzyme
MSGQAEKQRIPPSGPAEWAPETRAILKDATPASESPNGEGPPNILYTIAHHPALLPPFLAFSSALALRGVLARRDSEILALRAAWNCRSAFEWGHHVEYGKAEGLTHEQIQAIAGGPDPGTWEPEQRLLLRAADELHTRQDLPDELFAELLERFGHAEIVEIVFVVGQYTMLSMVANATGVPVEERLPPLPDRT